LFYRLTVYFLHVVVNFLSLLLYDVSAWVAALAHELLKERVVRIFGQQGMFLIL
jgi:hypothetical protein